MSNEAPKTTEQTEETLPLNVLIIAHKQSQLASAAAFLSRRGVPCTVKGNIKDGIQFITSQKATLVFLSWNLPNANIIKTYQLLTQNFKTNCVVFAEKPDGKTAAELTGSRLPEIMQAPVSGPGLYMRIQKILKAKDEQNKVDKVLGNKTHAHNNQNDKIVLKSSKGNEENEDDGFINLHSDGKDKNKPGIINFQSQNGPKYSTEDYEGTASDDPNANDISAYMDGLSDELPGEPTRYHDGVETDSNIYTQEGLKTKTNSAEQEGNNGNDIDFNQFGTPEGTENEFGTEGLSSDEKKARSGSTNKKEMTYGSVVNVAKKNKKANTSWKNEYDEKHSSNPLPEYEQTKPKESLIIDFKPRSGSKDSESILAQKTFEAIEKSVRPAYEDYAPVKVVSKAKIFNIHTPRFRGYMIFVIPMFNELDRGVLSGIKTNLEKLLKDQNEPLLHFEELNIDLEQTDFLSWAQENAEFFVQTVDHKMEIICAYYPHDPSMPKLDATTNKMTTVNIKDLKVNTKTNFNLYIHLPKNNKFVCYMKPGEVITEKHKNKFEKHSMKNLHIKKDEVRSFKEYFVSNQMKDILKKTEKKAA